jgi:hypothetical protein
MTSILGPEGKKKEDGTETGSFLFFISFTLSQQS